MINFRFKKMPWPATLSIGAKSDPSFNKRFRIAWINFKENELEAKVQTVAASSSSKTIKRY